MRNQSQHDLMMYALRTPDTLRKSDDVAVQSDPWWNAIDAYVTRYVFSRKLLDVV